MESSPSEPARAASRMRLWAEAALVVALIALGAFLRIDYTLECRHFDRESSAGILTTDPALIAYVTGRIVDAGGGIPADFRADPRIEHPDPCDIPAMFTVGQEFVVAWAVLALGERVPLHVVAVWIMSIFAAAVALGVWGLARALTGRAAWAIAAVALWTALPTSYRTLGFVLIREDFSLPFYAVHLWMVALAARRPGTATYLGVGASAAIAAATWHAVGSFLAIEVACALLWFVRSGQNPFGPRPAAMVLVPLLVLGMAIPVLRAKGFVLSLPVIAVTAMTVAGMVARARPGRARELIATAIAFAVAAGGSVVLARATGSGLYDYAHVFAFLADKLRHLGTLPTDPEGLSFGTRLLWQGPFSTASVPWMIERLGPTLLAVVIAAACAAPMWLRGRGDGRMAGFALFALAACVVTWLVQRTSVVAGITACAATALLLSRMRIQWAAWLLLLVTVGIQGMQTQRLLTQSVPWWARPDPVQVAERAHLVEWIREHVPAGEPVASDYLTSPGLLYHTGHPTLLQPKYETVRSRERIRELFEVFYRGTPAELRAWLAARGCRWLVLDRGWMWGGRYLAGITMAAKGLRGPSSAARFLFGEPSAVPGFELLYDSAGTFARGNFRVYRVR